MGKKKTLIKTIRKYRIILGVLILIVFLIIYGKIRIVLEEKKVFPHLTFGFMEVWMLHQVA